MSTQRAYTYRDFLTECENYKHSNECYETMKEAAEIVLIEQFIIDQRFNARNKETFTEGYLMESVSDEYIAEAEESLFKKAGALCKKIVDGIVKAVTNFFKWLKTSVTKLFKKKEVKVEANKLSEEERKELASEIVKVIEENQKDKKEIKIVTKAKDIYAGILAKIGIMKEDIDVFAGDLDTAFNSDICDNEFDEAVGVTFKNKVFYIKAQAKDAVSADVLAAALDNLCDLKDVSAHKIKSINDSLKNAMGKVIKIDLADDYTDLATCDNVPNIAEDIISANEDLPSKFIEELQNLQTTLNVVIPATSKLYAEVYSYTADLYSVFIKFNKKSK